MSSSIMKAVAKYLRPEETCVVAAEAKFLKKTSGKKRQRVFAVVQTGGRRRETAVFALKSKRFHQPVLKGIYPITSSFRVTRVNDSEFQIGYEETDGGDHTYLFEASRSSVQALLRPMMEALKAAKEGGLRHEWLSYYAVVDEPDNLPPPPPATTEDEGGEGGSDGAGGDAQNPLIANGAGIFNPRTVIDIKDRWIEEQMMLREDEFCDKIPLTIFLGTWNVNDKKPGDLDAWLCSADPACGIYAVGFQELDLSVDAFLLNNTTRSAPWEAKIEACLSQLGNYVLLSSKQLVGMLLCVYVRTDILAAVVDVQTCVVGVGIRGHMGNKGAVSIRFQVNDSTICMVNSHLAARKGNVERRNQDMKEIVRRLAFERESGAYGILDHDFVFWMGDLNYRIDLPDDQIKALCAAGDFEALQVYDQLTVQRRLNRTFVGFTEGPLTFMPTYKYDPGTNTWDTSEKKRSPAWCDRVLWISRKEDALTQLTYGRHELLQSDHRPVSATFEVAVKVVVKEKRAIVYHSVVRELDQLENESMPDASLSTSSIDFGAVRFGTPSTQELVVENTGSVMIDFSFIAKPSGGTDLSSMFCEPWLSLEPSRGLLMPGETCNVVLTALVGPETASKLTLGDASLEDILILHLQNGKDYFINVKGHYLCSCFGSSLAHLASLPLAIRQLPPNAFAMDSDSDSDERTGAGALSAATATTTTTTTTTNAANAATAGEAKLALPKELWRLVDYLYRFALDDDQLFIESGSESEVAFIRECLDTGASLDEFSGSYHSVAEALLQFLDALATPVIPFRMLPRCMDACNDRSLCMDLVGVLPAIHYNVFVYVVAFLRELLMHHGNTTTHAQQLAFIFSSVLMREPSTAQVDPQHRDEVIRKRAAFLDQFLQA